MLKLFREILKESEKISDWLFERITYFLVKINDAKNAENYWPTISNLQNIYKTKRMHTFIENKRCTD